MAFVTESGKGDMSDDEFDGLVIALKMDLMRSLKEVNFAAAMYALVELAYQGCEDQEDVDYLREVIDEVDDEMCQEEVTLQ